MGYEFHGPGLGTNGSTQSSNGGQQPAVQDEETETLFEQGWDWFREISGSKGQQPEGQGAAPMPGATPDGKPSAAGFSAYARETAVREVAVVDEEQAPIEETPSDAPVEGEDHRSWGERYQTHVTIVSSLVGLGTFVIWLMIRKKD